MAQMPDTNELLKRWPYLPDDAVVHTKVVAAVTGLSERTVRYDPRLKRVYLTSGRYGFRVGEVKKILTGAIASITSAHGSTVSAAVREPRNERQ